MTQREKMANYTHELLLCNSGACLNNITEFLKELSVIFLWQRDKLFSQIYHMMAQKERTRHYQKTPILKKDSAIKTKIFSETLHVVYRK